MGNQAVEPSVVLDAGEVAIVLDRHKRIAFECLKSERIAGRAEGFCIEDGVVALKEFLNDVEHRRLTRSRSTIEYHELLEPFGLSGYNGANSPFDFVALGWRV